MLGTFSYTAIFGYQSHVQTRRWLAAKKELAAQNERIQEQYAVIESALQSALEANEAAKQASQAKSAFLANMSHELRTPLNAILGYSEMLAEDAAAAGHADIVPDLQKIQTAGKHLLGLINDVLDLSKIEAGKMRLYLETFEVKTVVDEAAGHGPAARREERQPPRGALPRGHRLDPRGRHQGPAGPPEPPLERGQVHRERPRHAGRAPGGRRRGQLGLLPRDATRESA